MVDARCAFCGATALPCAPETVGGRSVCSPRCFERELARQAATPAERMIDVVEVDGERRVDQVAWATEWRRGDTDVAALHADSASATTPPR